jgi:hypothetical protein
MNKSIRSVVVVVEHADAMRRSIVLCVGLAACSEPAPTYLDAPSHVVDALVDAPAPRCEVSGSGSVNGSVGGTVFAPVQTAKVSAIAGIPTIVLAETIGPDLCAQANATRGNYLQIPVCTKATGTYPLSGAFPTCPSMTAGAVFYVWRPALTDYVFINATDGMLAIDSVDAACMTGTFSITFAQYGTVTGSLAASVCP